MKYPYGKQYLSKEDKESVLKVLDSELITQGTVTPAFEDQISKYVSSKHTIALSSATAALHLSCLTLGIDKNSIVWTSSISFVATSNAALYCGAQVEFVDINYDTGNINLEILEEKLKEAKNLDKLPDLLIVVHLGGSPVNMKRISTLKKQYNFLVLEDASHALGAEFNNHKVGSCEFSEICVFSFHPVKMITTGEGGAITTNSKEYFEKAYLLRSHGIERDPNKMKDIPDGAWKYEQQYLGYNYRISDINTALGLSQLKRLDSIVDKRRKLIKIYRRLFEDFQYGEIIEEIDNSKSSYHLALFRLRQINKIQDYKFIFDSLRAQGIGVQLHYYPIHLQFFYKALGWKKGDLPNSEKYSKTTLSIPLYEKLSEKDLKIISKIIKKTLISVAK